MPQANSDTAALARMRIESHLARALRCLSSRWSKLYGEFEPMGQEDIAKARIEMALSDYLARLQKVHWSQKGCLRKRIGYATASLLDSYDARIAAIVRAFSEVEPLCLPSQILSKAESLSVWTPLNEPVRIHWQQKAPGKFRPICVFGPKRKAQAFMVRDVLMIANVDAATNFAKRGAGGERGLVQQICTLIDEGKDWWWTPDVRSAFPSMRRSHFRWLGIDGRLLLNVIYLGKCAKIEMKLPKEEAAFTAYLAKAYPDLTCHVSLMDMAKLAVRRGLPQGSVLSPLLAGALIARLWCQSNPVPEAVMLSWHDDLNIGAETKAQLTKVKEQITQHFAYLSAGPIEFHDCPILPAVSGKVTVLGYRLQPGRGHIHYKDGSRSIHVKPGPKRIAKYMRRLRDKLANASPSSDLYEIAEDYHRYWFNSQASWTKVPECSFLLSQNINLSYVDDFKHGIFMS